MVEKRYGPTMGLSNLKKKKKKKKIFPQPISTFEIIYSLSEYNQADCTDHFFLYSV